jgi:hypothetical protein
MRTNSYLVRTISVSAIIFFLAFAVGSFNPAGEGGFLLGIIILSISALLLAIFWLILKMTRRRRQAPISSPEPDPVQNRTGFFTRRSTILLICYLIGKFALNVLVEGASGNIPSVVNIIVLHIIILVIFGVLYARWSGSEEYVPIVAALIVALADSSYYFVSYLSDSGHQFRFGPEIVWFAASGFSARLMLLAFYAVIIWGSWKLSATKRIARKHEDGPALTTLD